MSGQNTQTLLYEYSKKSFDWLKENDTDDNTAIAIVSDHGSNYFGNNIPVHEGGEPLHVSRSNALIMIKPPYKKEDMVIDSKTRLSNGDVIGNTALRDRFLIRGHGKKDTNK